jgi:DNA-binding SARP family transcriptional activator
LLGGFSLRIGGDIVTLPRHARRVLAFLSLDKVGETDCDRGVLAERLWTDAPVQRARASLRTALWRIRQASPVLVSSVGNRVWLDGNVDVDADRFRAAAEHLLSEQNDDDCSRLAPGSVVLLPGWDEEWLLLAREQLRQLRLHALEATGRRLTQRGRYPAAIHVMLEVVAEEPLRESAQAVLVDAHIGDGNMSEARRQFDLFASILWRELGLHPSPGLLSKVGLTVPLQTGRTAHEGFGVNGLPRPVGVRGPLTAARTPIAATQLRAVRRAR